MVDLKMNPGPIDQAPAVFIPAPVEYWREELAEKIAMGGVNLHPVKACLPSSSCRFGKGFNDFSNIARRNLRGDRASPS
jgi:hypothetical protein